MSTVNYKKPRQGLNKAFLKVRPERARIEIFKRELVALLDGVRQAETEEFHKNLIRDFLRKTYYSPEHFINTRGQFDLVIHHGKNNASPVAVIIEAKSPTNRGEMPSKGRLQSRAMQELLLYYLRERISAGNNRLTHLVITNVHEWFIFDAHVFESAFARNKTLVEQFNDFQAERLSSTTTDSFYREIAAPAIREAEEQGLAYTWFDVRDYETPLRNTDRADDTKLIPLFKTFAPEHLLKLPFANDSNTLDQAFYAELLHIIGLSETRDGSKKVIGRRAEDERLTGSLIENTIIQLESLGKIRRLSQPQLYGETDDERLFNVALTLAITWINRILFLKLLEAQLLSYHEGDHAYAFLNSSVIREFDDLNGLFFQVLAKRSDERHPSERELFLKVPYLNSSLFEPTDLEQEMLFVSNLRDGRMIPLHPRTVLRDDRGRPKSGEMTTLQYLFAFLDAYDFAGEGSEEIQEENKTLINASVLGLIFEKINGYRDGAFFTPGFVTMHMCREAIRSAVIRKFNDAKGWNCSSLTDVHNRIEDIAEANTIINSLRICDPAVGSGHFLVSALNELIAIKSELRILTDTEGRLLRDYHIEVANDEMIVLDGEGRLFEYRPAGRESARVQKALFHEKQTLIENCLFGVDINPNSVKICRLRLWIELLKNAYYLEEDVLETLPNIDINIKVGNSLVSRFPLDADLRKALRTSKWNVESYRHAVQTYRSAKTRDIKHEMEDHIRRIKQDFRVEIQQNDPLFLQRAELRDRLLRLSTEQTMFERSEAEERKRAAQLEKLTTELAVAEAEIEEIESGRLYENAFEWRFEFPEVLNDEADFVGFDVVIGNPPYIRQEEIRDLKPYLKRTFETYAGTADLYVYFIEQGLRLLRDGGEFIYIVPNKWMRGGYGKPLRNLLAGVRINRIVDFGDLPVFEEATTYPCILHLTRALPQPHFRATTVETLDLPDGLAAYEAEHSFTVNAADLQPGGWALVDVSVQQLIAKIRSRGIPLGEYVQGKIYYGIKTGLNAAFVIDAPTRDRLIREDPRSAEIIKPFLAGRDIKRYQQPQATRFLLLIKNGSTQEMLGKKLPEAEAWEGFRTRWPAVANHLEPFAEKARIRHDQGEYWWELRPCDYYEEFEWPKIFVPAIVKSASYAWDTEGLYGNDKTTIITGVGLELLAILNSSVLDFYLKSIAATRQNGYFEYKPVYLSQLPIAPMEEEVAMQLRSLVQEILDKKESGEPTESLEAEIDRVVGELYSVDHYNIA